MERKAVSGMMLTLLFIGMLTLAFNIQTVKAEPRTIIVPDEFSSIQEAINNANDGDTIYVRAGTYYENVVVNKTVSLVGENRNNTIIDGSNGPDFVWMYGLKRRGYVVWVSVNNTKITGFTIQNGYRGMVVHGVNNTISGNTVTNIGRELHGSAIVVEDVAVMGKVYAVSCFNVIAYNTILIPFPSRSYAIEMKGSENSLIFNNVINCTSYVFVSGCPNSVISNNVIRNARIEVRSSNNSLIRNNMLTYSEIYLKRSYNTSVAHNTINGSSDLGILLGADSKYNVISGNTIMNRSKGISLSPYWGVIVPLVSPPPPQPPVPTFNNVTENTIMNNNVGLYIENSYKNNIYHNNFVNNTRQVYTDVWDYLPPDYWPPWEYVWANGYPSGGNYWSDYKGVDLYSGPNQNQSGSDGIGDVSHFVGKVPEGANWLFEHIDDYPLMEPWSAFTMIETLIRTARFWNLHRGTENSLKVKLKVAIHMLDMGKEDGALRKLTAFINRVEMLREKTLTNGQADYLTLEAQRIIDLIEG